ncbi:sulfotransferase family 2 domain-containing protein [Demequina sp. NBRC 110056]|uniref:sulfotransferase family 2 domain-containing protein n=1 Tax=Demequina sp. NBRC 110056 TaxID=1570345 RepID=UPI0009FF9572|nr:sulfotransferase family 2 domain-containing protein [Demequina sp. NBRC 110056]
MPVLRKDGAALLFVHIPKTGGGSVEAAFKDAGWTMDFFDHRSSPGSVNALRRNSPQHTHAADLERIFRIDQFDAVFSFVRDPLARMRSEYVWRKRKQESIDASGKAFEKWLRSTFRRTLNDPWLHDNHMRPQVEFMVTGARNLRVEDGIAAGLAHLADLTGLNLPRSVPRAHRGADVTGVRPADIEVTARAARLVGEFYAEDYRRLGYERPDPPRTRGDRTR